MKKVSLFAGVAAVAVLAGGITAYTVTKATRDARPAQPGTAFFSEAGHHFTSYEPSKYPYLTYAAENAVKGVVNIEVRQEVENRRGSTQGFDPFFEFFGIPQHYQEQPRERRGGGSGVIISPEGYIVTNNHVVENATDVKVTLEDKRSFDAKVIGTDPTTDVALIKVDAKDLPSIPFGNSDDLRLGEWVLAIGSPYGLQNTVTAGIISAKARNLGVIPNLFSIESFIQTDAAVNPGNSGGALVNTKGELVGINTLIQSPTGSFTGYSFAVPSSIARKVVADLREYGVVQRALLGIQYREIDNNFIEHEGKDKGITDVGGVYIVRVDPEGGANAAGVKEGDIITHIEGMKIDNSSKLLEEVAKHRPNDNVNLMVKRGKETKQFTVTLRNKTGTTEIVKQEIVTAYDALGGQFSDVSDKEKKELRIDGGVKVIGIQQDGVLAKVRIGRGYIITRINDRAVRSISDLNRIIDPVESIDGIYPDGRLASYSLVR